MHHLALDIVGTIAMALACVSLATTGVSTAVFVHQANNNSRNTPPRRTETAR
jgi:hypothetical protein